MKEVHTRMKTGILMLLTVLAVGLCILASGVLTAADVPEKVLIQNEYPKDRKGPVSLSHKKHVEEYGAACTDCHHEYEGGKNVWQEGQPVKKCSACHDPAEKKGSAMKLGSAFHRNCKGCHKAYAAEHPDTKAPLKKCNDCHQKK
jgi:hypothetical protein